MNERFRLNSEYIRAWLDKEDRKTVYLTKRLNVSQRLVDRMLDGHVPKQRTIEALALLLGVEEDYLLLPRKSEGQKTA